MISFSLSVAKKTWKLDKRPVMALEESVSHILCGSLSPPPRLGNECRKSSSMDVCEYQNPTSCLVFPIVATWPSTALVVLYYIEPSTSCHQVQWVAVEVNRTANGSYETREITATDKHGGRHASSSLSSLPLQCNLAESSIFSRKILSMLLIWIFKKKPMATLNNWLCNPAQHRGDRVAKI